MKIHNIKKRIAIHGPVFWGQTLSEQLRKDGLHATAYSSGTGSLAPLRLLMWFLVQAARRSIVHVLTASTGPKLPWLAKLTGTPLIYHWIGTDTLRLVNLPEPLREKAVTRLNRLVPVHLADSPHIAEELSEIGLNITEVVRLLPPSVQADMMPFPPECAVMCYWSDDYADFHRAEWIMELARRFPHIPFRIVAATGRGLDAPPNVEFLGWRDDLTDIYGSSRIFLRLVKHDSLSAMVLESLARGRYVIYTRELQHCSYVQTFEDAYEALKELIEVVEPNRAGAEWVKENFLPQKQIDKLVSIYGNID